MARQSSATLGNSATRHLGESESARRTAPVARLRPSSRGHGNGERVAYMQFADSDQQQTSESGGTMYARRSAVRRCRAGTGDRKIPTAPAAGRLGRPRESLAG